MTRLVAALQGDLKAFVTAQKRAAERAVSEGVAAVGGDLLVDLRRQTASGLSPRMANTWRMKKYPSSPSIGAAAWIHTKAPTIISAHYEGALIRSKHGKFLAIPTPAAPRKGGKKPTPASVEAVLGAKLRFVRRPGKSALLVADGVRVGARGKARAVRSRKRKGDGAGWSSLRGVASAVMFILLPAARLKKKFNFAASFASAEAALPGAILARWRD